MLLQLSALFCQNGSNLTRDDDRDEQNGFHIHMAVYEPNTIIAAPVGDELEYLDEELAKAFPPHFAL